MPDLPIRWEPKLLSYLRFYRSHRRGRAIMRLWLRRMGRYEALIRGELQRQKLPRALIYVAMIESGFNPQRTSRVGASGLWQFMPRTGQGYGLVRDYWTDSRRDPKQSTEAALRYLRNLYNRTHSWELTLAAYNAGFGAVLRAIQKYNTNDYWQLARYEAGLPWSTSLYVPKILAVAIVGENRAAFGFGDVKPDPPLQSELVTLPRSLTLSQIGRLIGSTEEELHALNPALRRRRTPPRRGFWLRVPRGQAQPFYARLARLGALRYRPYRLRLGEDDASVARRFGVSRRTLRRINGVTTSAELRPGVLILVPAHAPRRHLTGRHVPKKDDAPLLVAVPRGSPRKIAGRRRVFYRVVLGDTLLEIACHLGVKVADLTQWNALDLRAKLISRMVLQAFVPVGHALKNVKLLDPKKVRVHVAGSAPFLAEHERRRGRRRVTYRVRRGDTLTRVAHRFGLTVGSLLRINRFGRTTKLREGQRLIVYQARSHDAKRKSRDALRRHRIRSRAARRERRRPRRPRHRRDASRARPHAKKTKHVAKKHVAKKHVAKPKTLKSPTKPRRAHRSHRPRAERQQRVVKPKALKSPTKP